MTAVSKLYNPFRDEKDSESKSEDPFGNFNFAIQPAADISLANASSASENDPQHPDFDPFQIADITRKGSNDTEKKSQDGVQVAALAPPRAITPKLVVKLTTKEEVTSRVKMALDEFDVTSEITVEGTVMVSLTECMHASVCMEFH